MLVDELSYLGIQNCDFSELGRRAGFDVSNELFYAISVGNLAMVEIVEHAAELFKLGTSAQQLELDIDDTVHDEISITGQGDLPYQMADCCLPGPGDLILGIVSPEERVFVHKEDCQQVFKADVYGRMVQLDWRGAAQVTFPVSIEIQAYDRFGLLHDITGILTLEKTNVQSINTDSNYKNNQVILKMVLEVSEFNFLLQALEKIERLPNVLSAKRNIGTVE